MNSQTASTNSEAAILARLIQIRQENLSRSLLKNRGDGTRSSIMQSLAH
jgi:hypothetical protein